MILFYFYILQNVVNKMYIRVDEQYLARDVHVYVACSPETRTLYSSGWLIREMNI